MSGSLQVPLLEERGPAGRTDPGGEFGEVFTRRWVVDLMLDLVGYRPEADLGARVIVEPSCGCGAFLVPIVERLAQSCALHGRRLSDLAGAVSAFDLLDHNAEIARKAIVATLIDLGESPEHSEYLSQQWVKTSDFLLEEEPLRLVDFVVGNPPYVRLEDIPKGTSNAYRSRWPTMRGRADIYIGFFEKGLSLLGPEGRLSYICADRWMRNQYGAQLRRLVSSQFAVDSVIVMHEVNAFEDAVSAYPAITVLRNGAQGGVHMVDASPSFNQQDGASVLEWTRNPRRPVPVAEGFEAGELPGWFDGPALWPAGSPRVLELLSDLESRFAPLEDAATGTRVGIGVATGCDDVYIQNEPEGVEANRLLPLLTASDISTGHPEWARRHLVNPWDEGGLVDLRDYPGLAEYFHRHRKLLRSRHVARRQPNAWYRTIDRVVPELIDRPKLLLPDIKARSHPVLDPGGFYPHHNLYYVVSDSWDLEVLGGLLLSDIANLFVGAYCVKMRGGTYRFQAQYLRKIRVPALGSISSELEERLRSAFRSRDRRAASDAAAEAYEVVDSNQNAGVTSLLAMQLSRD